MEWTQFPAFAQVVESWHDLRDEVVALETAPVLKLDRMHKSHEEFVADIARQPRGGWVQGWGYQPDRWLNFALIFDDEVAPHAAASAPKTAALFQRLRGVKIAGFSLFLPGTLLPAHDHPELREERLFTLHLGLRMAPDFNYLFTGGEFIREEPGKAFVFDGAPTHFAFNASGEPRSILYVEFSPEKLRLVDGGE
jgi:aspartyl/asparaginyl beta-hydroxylase (cupin superfamily)